MREFYEAVKRQKRGRIGWILCWICGCMWGAFVGRWGSYYAKYPQMSRGAKLLDCIAVGLSFFCAACWLFETFNSLFPYHVSEANNFTVVCLADGFMILVGLSGWPYYNSVT